jgi:hypothetical protein
LRRCCERLAKDVEKEARRWAGETEISGRDIKDAWTKLVSPYEADETAESAIAAPRSRRAPILLGLATLAAIIVVASVLYLIFSLVKPKLPADQYWPAIVIIATLAILYLMLINLRRATVAVWGVAGTIIGTLSSWLAGGLSWLAWKGSALAGALFRVRRKDRDQAVLRTLRRIRPNAGKEGPATAESTSDRDNGVHISRRRRRLVSMPSSDVREMQKIVAPLIDNTSTNDDDLQRRNLAVLLLRMYTDLDKSVRRSDESGTRSKWTVRVGAAATAAASAVAGTTLVAGSTGTVAIVVGAVTAALGVIGSVVAALKLSTSIAQNESDHAQYLPLLRQLGSYAAVGLFKDDVQAIQAQLDTFATKISSVEAQDAAAAAAAITQ